MYCDIPNDLKALIEPIVEDQGCELVDVHIVNSGQSSQVRVTIDSSTGDGRVPVECCAEVSREIETQLDAANSIPGSYRLEVSSPGLNRILAREKDFAAACGSEIKVETRRLLDGRRRFRGVLVAFSGDVARVEVDGRETEIPFSAIEKANTVYQFSRADFNNRSAK